MQLTFKIIAATKALFQIYKYQEFSLCMNEMDSFFLADILQKYVSKKSLDLSNVAC